MNKFEFTRKEEGNLSHTPYDDETYAGINSKWHPHWSGWKIIADIKKTTGFSKITAADNTALEVAVHIFYGQWWMRYELQRLPKKLAIALFDTTFMSGKAVWLLQKSINFLEPYYTYRKPLDADNDLGDITLGAIKNVSEEELLPIFIYKRIKYQMKLQDRLPFYRGWSGRSARLGLYLQKWKNEI